MRRKDVSAVAATLLMFGVAGMQIAAHAQERADAKEAAARYAAADIRVMAPGVIYNAGLLDLAAAYTKETGKKVAVMSVGMGTIVKAVKTANPPADVIMLPLELMSTLTLDGGVVPGSYRAAGALGNGLGGSRGRAASGYLDRRKARRRSAWREGGYALESRRRQHGGQCH